MSVSTTKHINTCSEKNVMGNNHIIYIYIYMYIHGINMVIVIVMVVMVVAIAKLVEY